MQDAAVWLLVVCYLTPGTAAAAERQTSERVSDASADTYVSMLPFHLAAHAMQWLERQTKGRSVVVSVQV